MFKQISVSIPGGDGCPSFNTDLGRVNVVLGVNGSGKSKLLHDIAFHVRESEPESTVVQTVGGRQIFLQSSVSGRATAPVKTEFKEYLESQTRNRLQEISRDTVQEYSDMGGRNTLLTPESRLQSVLTLLASQIAGFEVDYRKKLFSWGESNRSEEAPTRQESDLLTALLGLFTEIFPEITISAVHNPNVGGNNSHSFTLECCKRGKTYPIYKMSDGEKQVFASLADRFVFADTQCVFIVDEPELNLDPALACNFWNVMEREMPESTFLFATHSMDFALRQGVENIWVLGQKVPTKIDKVRLKSLSIDEQRVFLGSIRGIVIADIGVVVEGEGADTSIDAIIYPWLLGTNTSEVCVRSYGGCDDVIDATKKIDIWEEIAPSAKVVGIVDRDYRSDEKISAMENSNCVVLNLHDIESYLCMPCILVALAKKLQIKDFPAEQDIKEKIELFFSNQTIVTAARRMSLRCSVKRQISIKKEVLASIDSDAKLIKSAKEYATIDQNNPPAETSVDKVAAVTREEIKRCNDALKNGDLIEQLTLFRGKELLDEIAKLFLLADGKALAEYVVNHLAPDDFSHFRELKTQILERAKT